jgi:hypothetical protein
MWVNNVLDFAIVFRCSIDWKKGKNVTVRVVKKVQKHKNRGTKRTVTQTVKNDSFFNFFDPPKGSQLLNIVVVVVGHNLLKLTLRCISSCFQ